jgi:hypothetical protein
MSSAVSTAYIKSPVFTCRERNWERSAVVNLRMNSCYKPRVSTISSAFGQEAVTALTQKSSHLAIFLIYCGTDGHFLRCLFCADCSISAHVRPAPDWDWICRVFSRIFNVLF